MQPNTKRGIDARSFDWTAEHRDAAGCGGEIRVPKATPRRVLVIEDNVDAADSLRDILEFDGHAVAVAHSGPEGVEAARSYVPEIVLCDIGLPGMDGYDVAKAIRAEPALASVFLVALSGYSLPEDVMRSQEAGFDRHLAKPPDLGALERILEEAPVRAPGE